MQSSIAGRQIFLTHLGIGLAQGQTLRLNDAADTETAPSCPNRTPC